MLGAKLLDIVDVLEALDCYSPEEPKNVVMNGLSIKKKGRYMTQVVIDDYEKN